MIGMEKIKDMKKAGEVIITQATFQKRVKVTRKKGGNNLFEYKGVTYNCHDWLLTYGYKQYQHLYNR